MDRQSFAARLEVLPNPLRVAIGAACVERVLPIFEAMSDDPPEAHRAAIDLAWRYAAGEAVDHAEIRATLARIPTHALEDDDGQPKGSLARVVARVDFAVLNLLRAIDGAEKIPGLLVGAAIENARDAVYRFEKYEDVANHWALAEDEWQGRLLARAESCSDAKALRTAGEPPVWRAHLDAEW